MKAIISVFFIFIFTTPSNAFDWEKCKEVLKGGGMGFQALGSTSQYTTSTGQCAMIGRVDYDKKVYFSQNFENLRLDTAQGGGEYLSAYAQLSQCDGQGQVMIGKTLQNHFKKIYIGTKDDSVEAIFNRFELVFQTESILANSCGSKQSS